MPVINIFSDLCLSDSDNQFGALLFILHKNQHKYLNDSLKEYDLNIMQALFLIRISKNPNITQNDLAEWFFLSKGSVAKSLNILENRGFIKRERDRKDTRKYNLMLTQKSEDLLPVFKKLANEWNEKVGLSDYGEDFYEKFKKLTIESVKINNGGE